MEINNNFDHIPFRINSIKELLSNKELQPMIDLNTFDIDSSINNTNDIRDILNKKILDFNNTINQIGGKLLYIKSGTTGHTFKGIFPDYINKHNKHNINNYAVKVVAYPKKENYGDLNDVKRPENAELLMLKVLSYFVINNQTPHIVLPIGTFNTPIKPFVKLKENKIVDNKKYDLFINRYQKKEYHNDVSILISEWANSGDLLDYLRNNYKVMSLRTWRVLFFQIISVLAVIQKKYPDFRHNDLKANNILIHTIEIRNKNNKFKYKINGKDYIVPNIGFQIKLWDFDFACIPGIVDNSKVDAEWTNKINVNTKRNRYYDLHYFFNTLTKKGFFPQFWEDNEISKRVKDFVKRIIPEEYRSGKYVAERGRILIDKEFTTPDKILRFDPFFDKMRSHHNTIIE